MWKHLNKIRLCNSHPGSIAKYPLNITEVSSIGLIVLGLQV